MIFLRLALKSLRSRRFSSILTILTISLSVALLFAVERTKRATEEGFTQSISQTDLLVGARTGPMNLILFTVFNIGNPTNNISWKSYQEIKSNPVVEWTIPYSLGDGHEGFRVVGTDENFYRHYRFRGDQQVELSEGKPALGIWDVVIGSDVEKKLKYKIGDKVIIAHGVTHGKGLIHHEDKPFHVVGILKPTGTAIDQSLYISLAGMEAMHIEHLEADQHVDIDEITAFFLRTRHRIETLKLQRDINTYSKEPLLAIIPSMTLAELWRSLSQIDMVLKIISLLVMGVGLASMLSSILAGLNERRREMSILRSIGAGPITITALLVFESGLLTISGVALGIIIELSSFFLLSSWMENTFGLYLTGAVFGTTELLYSALVIILGLAIGLIPAYRATRLVLKDGLSAKI